MLEPKMLWVWDITANQPELVRDEYGDILNGYGTRMACLRGAERDVLRRIAAKKHQLHALEVEQCGIVDEIRREDYAVYLKSKDAIIAPEETS